LRIGILGGTFNPIHIGHLRIAEEVGEDLELDKLYLVPGGQPPHKKKDGVTPFEDRLAMIRLAIENAGRLDVLDLEGRREGLSYSIETLQELSRRFTREVEFYFLIGTDAFFEIETWKDYQRLFDYTHFIVFRRPGSRNRDLKSFLYSLDLNLLKPKTNRHFQVASGKTIVIKDVTSLDISSTSIRLLLEQGRSIRFLVPDRVRDYILEKGLYRSHGNT
jgi:nicotinate-nucleotide adenylyltransferase